ncbi:MAG: hypothetical protein JHC33_10110 [Ignisphaera sp.]|nr:hypothetical protein [Ignisphaera sp.]
MRPEDFVEKLKGFIDSRLLFTAVEEARTLGHNIIYLIANVDDVKVYASFLYKSAFDDLEPLAIMIEFGPEATKTVNLSFIARVAKDIEVYIFGGESAGLLMPVSSVDYMLYLLKSIVPELLAKILNKKVDLVFENYELEFKAI